MSEAKKSVAIFLGVVIGIAATWMVWESLGDILDLWVVLVLGILAMISAAALLYKFAGG